MLTALFLGATCLSVLPGSRAEATVTITLSVTPPADTSINGNEQIAIEAFVTSNINQLFKGGQIGFFCTITSGSTVLTTNGVSSVTTPPFSAGGIPPLCPGGVAASNQPNCFASRSPLPLAPPCLTFAGVPSYLATITYDVSDCATDSVEVHAEPLGVADGVPDAVDETRFRDDGPGIGNLIPIVGEVFATLVPDLGTCCNGANCMMGGVNQYCCEQGLCCGPSGTFNTQELSCGGPSPCGGCPSNGLVVNGNFDAAVPTNGTGNGWTSNNINSSGGWSTLAGNPVPYFILNDTGVVVDDPTIEQVVAPLVVGQSYRLTGDYISVYHNDDPLEATNSFVVELNGGVVYEAGPTADHVSDPNPTWASFDVSFTATATSMNVRMRAEANGTDNDFGVDNVAVCSNCPCNGDVNGNMIVDVDDLTLLLGCLCDSQSIPGCDLNCDGQVNLVDLGVFLCGSAGGTDCCPTPPIGACMNSFFTLVCSETNAAICNAGGGTYQGDGTSCTLNCPCACSGDINNSGTITAADFSLFLDCLGGVSSDPDCDVNCDGVVDLRDLGDLECEFRGNFPPGQCCEQVHGACCVPLYSFECIETPEATCDDVPGEYHGDGTTCDPSPCDCNNNGIPDDCELDCAACPLTDPPYQFPQCGRITKDCDGDGIIDTCEDPRPFCECNVTACEINPTNDPSGPLCTCVSDGPCDCAFCEVVGNQTQCNHFVREFGDASCSCNGPQLEAVVCILDAFQCGIDGQDAGDCNLCPNPGSLCFQLGCCGSTGCPGADYTNPTQPGQPECTPDNDIDVDDLIVVLEAVAGNPLCDCGFCTTACCLPGDLCDMLSPAQCLQSGGTPHPPGRCCSDVATNVCVPVTCP
ncbi:MAG: hypothetical protein AABZ47_07280 [Planctomycetota bacterium]